MNLTPMFWLGVGCGVLGTLAAVAVTAAVITIRRSNDAWRHVHRADRF